MSSYISFISLILVTIFRINPVIVSMLACICVISVVFSIVVVVSVCMMVVAVLMKSELVPKPSREVNLIRIINDSILRRKLAESCLLYRWDFVEAISREDICVLTLLSSIFAYVSDASVFSSSLELVLHL